jgi:hypothetical protein
MSIRIELPQGVNPQHFAATYSFLDLKETTVYEYGGSSFTKRDFEHLLTKLEADPSTTLLGYAIEDGPQVDIHPLDWERCEGVS